MRFLTRSLRSRLGMRAVKRVTGLGWPCTICGCPCTPIASAPLPLPTVGGLCVRSGLPRRFAPPLPRRVALPLRGLLWRPAPSWAPLWRPLSLAAVLAPMALAVSAGHPRSLRARGRAAPSPVLPPAGGALLPLSPLYSGSLPIRVAAVLALLPPSQTPAHTPYPLAHPEGDFNRLGHLLSATAQNSPTSIPTKPPPTPPTPSRTPRGISIGWVIFCRLPHRTALRPSQPNPHPLPLPPRAPRGGFQ